MDSLSMDRDGTLTTKRHAGMSTPATRARSSWE